MSKIKKLESSLVNLDFMNLDVLGLAKLMFDKVAPAYRNKETGSGSVTGTGQFVGETNMSGICQGKGASKGIGGKGGRGKGGCNK
ncbi:MAG: hypothetical protein HQK89_16815 [Nitrospirae bacterium]|nr:hypothetical protein [Nitrospirota bacterium]